MTPMTEPIRPVWLTGLRIIGPAEPILSDHYNFATGSWIVRHEIDSQDLAELTRRGHPMVPLDESHTLIAPMLYLPS